MTKKKEVEKKIEEEVYPLGYYEPLIIKNEHEDSEQIFGYLVKLNEHTWYPVHTELEAINLSFQIQILEKLNEVNK